MRNKTKMVDKKQIIVPGSQDAPKLSSGRPKELQRFIRQIEDLWKECGVESDIEKKESIGDTVKLYSYWWAFLVEANKLMKPPAVM